MTVLTVGELQARVDRGVEWLDQHIPDWWHADRPSQGFDKGGAIDLDALSMSRPCWCVLGQLLGSFYRAEITLDQAVAFGFDASSATGAATADEFEALTELWSRVIEARRAAVPPDRS